MTILTGVRGAIAAAAAGWMLAAAPAAADEVRDFTPNRPSRSDSPFTVPAGYVQIETDSVSYTHPADIFQALDPTVLVGVAHASDIEISIGGLVSQGAPAPATGFGDVVLRFKQNLAGDDGGDITAAVIPYVKFPSARAPIGNEDLEGGVNAPVLINLPWALGLSVEPEFAVLSAAPARGRQESFTGIVNLGRRIVGGLSGFVELYAQDFTGPAASKPAFTFDYGFSYLLSKTVQIDVGENLGLSRASPALNLYTGLAFRF